jgi:hypothetical protein
MKTTRVFAWACALAVAGVVSAQEPWSGHELQPPEGAAVAVAPVSGEWVAKDRVVDLPNPVPTRIETSYYGERLFPNALQIECSIYGEEPCIRVVGEPGTPVVLFCAMKADETVMPWGVVLVSPQCVAIPGWFDRNGHFDFPVDLGCSPLCDNTFYFQALQVADAAPPRLSWGFKVRYARGNAQPAEVQYAKPAMQVIPYKAMRDFLPAAYAALIRFEAEESYALTVEDVYRVAGKQLIYVRMRSPLGPSGPKKWHRAVVDLGWAPEPEVEVWVTVDHAQPFPVSKLRAVVETEF